MFGNDDTTNGGQPMVNEPLGDAAQGHQAIAPPPSNDVSTPHSVPEAPSAPAVSPAPNGPSDSAGDFIMTEPHQPGPPSSDNSATAPPASALANNDGDDLLDLKQQALQQLTPLVDHLEQTPEEKFRTTMMMIQASDNKALLKSAYEAAHEIPDEKSRAQALLDVVNEINYFTQQHNGDDQPESEA
jgi:hypothetical protein